MFVSCPSVFPSTLKHGCTDLQVGNRFLWIKMSYMLPHLHNGWQVDQAILSEEDRVLVIRFGHDWDPTCMKMDEVLYSIAEKVGLVRWCLCCRRSSIQSLLLRITCCFICFWNGFNYVNYTYLCETFQLLLNLDVFFVTKPSNTSRGRCFLRFSDNFGTHHVVNSLLEIRQSVICGHFLVN